MLNGYTGSVIQQVLHRAGCSSGEPDTATRKGGLALITIDDTRHGMEEATTNSRRATWVLAGCAAGAAGMTLADYAGGGFWTGLFQHGFLAATVGGLADWYAVTAIFHKPLGIGWRTDILRKNRPRIMGALLDFVTGDLLNPENIVNDLKKQDYAAMLVRYLTERGGRDRLFAVLDTLIVQAVRGFDTERAATALAGPVRDAMAAADTAPLLRQALRALDAPLCRARSLKALAPLLRPVLLGDEVQALLLKHITAMREAYEGKSVGRTAMFSALALTDEKILQMADNRLAGWLDELEQGEGEAWDGLNRWLSEKLAAAAEDPALFSWLEDRKARQLAAFDFAAPVRERLDGIRQQDLTDWRAALRNWFDAIIDEFQTRADWQANVNAWLRDFLEQQLLAHYRIIPETVEAYLSHLSDDELIELAETRVADDLQMIRINGSVVGAFVGMALYLLVSALERMWG